MFRHGPSILTLTVALAGAADSPPADPLDVIRSGNYSTNASADSSARVLNWNIDRDQHFKGIVAAMRETRPDLRVFQEVDLGARRTKGEDVAQNLAQTFGMNTPSRPNFWSWARAAFRSGPRASRGSPINPDFGSRGRC